MKNLFQTLVIFLALPTAMQAQLKTSQYPNSNNVPATALVLWAIPGVTNVNQTEAQLATQILSGNSAAANTATNAPDGRPLKSMATTNLYGANRFIVDPVLGNDSSPVDGYIYRSLDVAAKNHSIGSTFILQPGWIQLTNVLLTNGCSVIGQGQSTVLWYAGPQGGNNNLQCGPNTTISDLVLSNVVIMDFSTPEGCTNSLFENLVFHNERARDIFLWQADVETLDGFDYCTLRNITIYAGWDGFNGLGNSLLQNVVVYETNVWNSGFAMPYGNCEFDNCSFYITGFNASASQFFDFGGTVNNLTVYLYGPGGGSPITFPTMGNNLVGNIFFSTNNWQVDLSGARYWFDGTTTPYRTDVLALTTNNAAVTVNCTLYVTNSNGRVYRFRAEGL